MRFEIPECRRCCFCLPLRYGLLVWSYLNLVLLTIALVDNIRQLYYVYASEFIPSRVKIIFTFAFFIIMLSLGITILLIVAAHKKSSTLLKIYYVCAFWTTIVHFTTHLVSFVFFVTQFDLPWRQFALVYVLQFIIVPTFQIYIIVLVRSEILKLENNHSFRYINNAAAADSAFNETNYTSSVHHNSTENNDKQDEKDVSVERIYIDVPDT